MHDIVVDAHSHVYQYSREELEQLLSSKPSFLIVGVGEDFDTSKMVVELAEKYEGRIYPCVGVHPWNIDGGTGEVDDVLSLAMAEQVDCIGEVGLDKKFVIETFDKQVPVFTRFLEYAKENNMVLNIHAAGAWREVFDLLIKHDVSRALFHWYTGPIDLLKDIEYSGYYVSINAAIIIQEKSKRIAEKVPLNIMLLESDGPYNYRGLRLNSRYILEAAGIIGSLRGLTQDEVIRISNENAMSLFNFNTVLS
ncbi:MAG: TatD family hydrolase [Desulfurococcales archaeon]|nr:TatD family hydrolase [Desulfurococcales archaeon]